MSNTVRTLRATAGAGLVATALMLGPAAAAFAVPNVQNNTPTPSETSTTTGSTEVAHGAYRPCLHGGPACRRKEPAMKPEEKGPTG